MILLTNGDSWTQGDAPAQDINWEAKPNLDWYNIIPDFGEPSSPTDDRITYKFYARNSSNTKIEFMDFFNTFNSYKFMSFNFSKP